MIFEKPIENLRGLLILTVVAMFFSCENKSIKHKEKENVFEGTYQVTQTGRLTQIGVWVFSENEISILMTENLENTYGNLGLKAVQKYYIEENIIFTCLCTTSNCLDKTKNYEKLWKIDSISQTDTKRIIILTNVFNDSLKVKLEKDKSIGLDVEKWE